MRILAIETSCDETAIALLEANGGLPAGRQGLKSPRFRVLKNLISSQIETHRPWGGVVPNLAKREHLKNLPHVFENLKLKNGNYRTIDLLATTVGPGLEPCLWAGIEFTKEIYKKLKIENSKLKILGANHLEGHLYSFLLSKKYTREKDLKNLFPAIALIVSGGHTILLYLSSLTKMQKLGETRDDAVGECFDKAARMLELPFPGGPEIQRLAAKGNPNAINFPRPMINTKDYDFSFSGLKTSVLYHLRDLGYGHRGIANGGKKKSAPNPIPKTLVANTCASFQKAAIDVLVAKTMRAARVAKARSVMLSGGVAANKLLRKTLEKESKKIGAKFFAPEMAYNTDNAAMIGVAAYINFLRKKNRKIIAQGNLNL